MATELDWNNLPPPSKNKTTAGRRSFVKFESGKAKVVRPIGKAVQFYKMYVNNRSITVDPEFKDKARDVLSAKAGEEVIPKHRFAINVIDRDDGQIKILEGGTRIFNNFANWSKANNNVAPGGNSGWDWSILPEGEKLSRQYTVTPVRPAPFSNEESAKAKAELANFSLTEFFKGCPVDELVDRAYGDGRDAGPEPASGGSDDPVAW